MTIAEEKLAQALDAFYWGEPLVGAVRYGNGHINDTFCVHTQPRVGEGQRFILQRINQTAFPCPEQLMENMVNITQFLRQTLTDLGEDPSRGTLTLLKTKTGLPCYTDDEGSTWRATHFVENTVCLDVAQTPEQFYFSARAFGRFQRLLGAYPADTLHETIPHFHDTEKRLFRFREAVAQDRLGRAASVQAEIDFALSREADCSVCMQALRDDRLPLRVTHNDTKLNNVLLEKDSGEGICVIDLDTVMPGLSVNDFGDSIRFGANHSAEDEQDLSKVNFDLPLYEAYTRGFLEEAIGVLTQAELEYLPWGAKLMTLECGIRFLTDYLEGDTYFHTNRPNQNLDRCRTQFKLVADMERAWNEMNRIVVEVAAELKTTL